MKNIFFLSLGLLLFSSCTYYIGPNRWAHSFPEKEYVVPNDEAQFRYKSSENKYLFEEVFQQQAQRNYIQWSTKFQDTVLDTRVILAKLLSFQDIEQVNADIMRFKAWGTTGTSSKLNKKGDYDFSELVWSYIVWQFKEEPSILFPATAQHIIDNLIIDNGSKTELRAPKTLGLIRETENHILMKEGSRYLKNQWLFDQTGLAQYDNKLNGMEKFLIDHLHEMKKTGFYEFNATPYISYTLDALHLIYNFAESEEIKNLAKEVMDAENWQYALGSYDYKRFAPFRRRMEHINDKGLFDDRHGTYIRMEMTKINHDNVALNNLPCCYDRVGLVGLSSYRLPEQTARFIEDKPNSYLAKIGHGIKASPEIYYGSSAYLLSAGGLRWGKKSQISPRVTALFLDDDAKTIEECFHIPGKGNPNQWNNTGVYRNFAVGNQNVQVPSAYLPKECFNAWTVYLVDSDLELHVCVYNAPNFGLIYIHEGTDYKKVLAENSTLNKVKSNFYFSETEYLNYEVKANKKWVIRKINGEKQLRRFGKWPRFDVDFSK
ncbi:MAG: hypothetical protein H6579_09110 [Chitinophagales bacterium]|nr:hypothetical protein [Chitinophagales bacterium]